jgi:hypothetical protein
MTKKLKDFVADLITDELWSADVLSRLLTSAASTWHSVPELCAGNEEALQSYRSLMRGAQSELMATWLPHPANGGGSCIVLFYWDDEMTSTVAVLNRARHLELLQKAAAAH